MEEIGPELSMGETVFLGLRLDQGISAQSFLERHGVGLFSTYGEEIQELKDQGLLEVDAEIIRLTDRGRMLANQVFIRFLR